VTTDAENDNDEAVSFESPCYPRQVRRTKGPHYAKDYIEVGEREMAKNPKNMGLSYGVNFTDRSSRKQKKAAKMPHERMVFQQRRIRYTPDATYILPLETRDSTSDGDKPEEGSKKILAVYPDPDVFMSMLLKAR